MKPTSCMLGYTFQETFWIFFFLKQNISQQLYYTSKKDRQNPDTTDSRFKGGLAHREC